MPKVTGPLGSFTIIGQIKDGPVYQQRNGVSLARTQAPPAQPRTAAQQISREALAWSSAAYVQAAYGWAFPNYWIAKQFGRAARPNFNAMNVSAGRTASATVDLPFLKPKTWGLEPIAAALSKSGSDIRYTVTLPLLPFGWQGVSIWVVAMPRQAPRGAFIGPMINGSEAWPTTVVFVTVPYTGGTWDAFGYVWVTDPTGNPQFSHPAKGTFTVP